MSCEHENPCDDQAVKTCSKCCLVLCEKHLNAKNHSCKIHRFSQFVLIVNKLTVVSEDVRDELSHCLRVGLGYEDACEKTPVATYEEVQRSADLLQILEKGLGVASSTSLAKEDDEERSDSDEPLPVKKKAKMRKKPKKIKVKARNATLRPKK